MAKEKYINSSNGKHVKRRMNKGAAAVMAAIILCVLAIPVAVALFKTRSPAVKTAVSSSQSSAVHAKTSSAQIKPIATTKAIPVIMYHSVNYDPKNPGNILRVPKEKFEAEMKWLYDNGYKTLTLDDFYSHISGGVPFEKKSVVLTFDDGYEDNYTSAFPIIKKYHFNATVFMITSRIGDSKNGYLTASELKEMDNGGMRIECHTVTHPDLDTLSYKRQLKELTDSKDTLEKLLGRDIEYIAYPTGKHNANSIKAAKNAGYKVCFNMNGGTGMLGNSPYEFPRSFVGSNLSEFISKACVQ